MRKRLLSALVVWALSASGVHAGIEIQHWQTANGARVYFVETHQLPMVQLSVGFDAGSARDPLGKSGLAHLVNIGVKQGAADMDAKAISEALDTVGAELSNENGRDMSVFQLRSLSDKKLLSQGIDVLAKMIALPTFPADAIERERQRVLVKLARQKQSPREISKRKFYATLFAGHAYANPPTGDDAGIKAITRVDLIQFHARYFGGSNAVLTLVGDLTRAQAESLANKLMAKLPRGRAAPWLKPAREPIDADKVDIAFPSTQTHVLMGQLGISRKDPDYYALYLGNHILGGSGLISRLAVEIREKRGLAYSVYSYFLPMRDRGPFIIGLQTRNDQTQLAEQLARETVKRFVEEGPSEEEVDASKKNITGGFALLIDSNQKIAGNLLVIGFYNLPLDHLDTYTQKIDALTVEQVSDAFRRRVDPQRLVRVMVGGQNR